MGKLKINLKPLFIIYIFLCLYFGWTNIIFYYIVTIVIHEYAHIVVAKKLGYQINSMIFSVSGVGIYGNFVFKERDDIKISLAGPLLNFCVIICLLSVWWVFPSLYLFTKDFFVSNIVVLIFNSLPIFPLDGGRVVMALLSLKGSDKLKVKRVMSVVSLSVGVLFCLVFIVSIFFVPNYNLLVIGIFLAVNSLAHDNNRYYSQIASFVKNNVCPMEIREFIVSNDNQVELLKLINPHYYSVFIYYKNGEKIRIEERDLLK